MLTTKENRFNIFFIKLYAQLNFLPIQVETHEYHGTAHQKPSHGVAISIQTRRWRIWMYHFFLAIMVFDGFYVCVRFAQSLLVAEMFHVQQFPIHFFWGASNLVVQFWTKQSFFKWSGYTIGILHQISMEISIREERSRRWYQMNRQELLGKYLHPMFFITALVMIGVLLWDWSRLLLIYTALPNRYQSVTSFFICLVFEIITIFMEISCTSINFYKQVLFFELVISKLQSMIVKVQRSATAGQKSVKTQVMKLHQLQLLIQCFNQGNCYMLFASKLICLSAPVLCGFVAIRYFHVDPITGTLCVVLIINAVACYALIYEKAFLIPAKMLTLQDLMKVMLYGRQCEKMLKDEVTKTLRSIPTMGVRVGGFNTMERSSTLIYMDFITEKLVSILVVTKY